jgi:hypothetical protein
VCTFVLIQKYQKIKTCTEMALEAGLPCGKAENSLRSNSRPCLSQGRPASTLRDGNFSNGRKIRKKGTGKEKRGQSPFSRELSFSPFSVAISGKKDGP